MFKLKTHVLMATDFAASITERTHDLHASYHNTVGETHGNRQVRNGETDTDHAPSTPRHTHTKGDKTYPDDSWSVRTALSEHPHSKGRQPGTPSGGYLGRCQPERSIRNQTGKPGLGWRTACCTLVGHLGRRKKYMGNLLCQSICWKISSQFETVHADRKISFAVVLAVVLQTYTSWEKLRTRITSTQSFS